MLLKALRDRCIAAPSDILHALQFLCQVLIIRVHSERPHLFHGNDLAVGYQWNSNAVTMHKILILYADGPKNSMCQLQSSVFCQPSSLLPPPTPEA